jgi:hypothetical protein
MGTNYYVMPEACGHCGRGGEPIHIGKSSIGWQFLFAPLDLGDGNGCYSWREWRAYLADKQIVDEYGRSHTLAEFADLVESKQNSGLCALTASNEMYGFHQRDRFEFKDDEGYRISKEGGFS